MEHEVIWMVTSSAAVRGSGRFQLACVSKLAFPEKGAGGSNTLWLVSTCCHYGAQRAYMLREAPRATKRARTKIRAIQEDHQCTAGIARPCPPGGVCVTKLPVRENLCNSLPNRQINWGATRASQCTGPSNKTGHTLSAFLFKGGQLNPESVTTHCTLSVACGIDTFPCAMLLMRYPCTGAESRARSQRQHCAMHTRSPCCAACALR